MATEIQTIKASQLEELTEVTDSNYVVVTDGATSKKIKITVLKGNDYINVKSKGVQEGQTDDIAINNTEIIQNLIDSNDDLVLYFPSGIYRLNRLNFGSNKNITFVGKSSSFATSINKDIANPRIIDTYTRIVVSLSDYEYFIEHDNCSIIFDKISFVNGAISDNTITTSKNNYLVKTNANNTKGKLFLTNCSFIGWKQIAGDVDVLTKDSQLLHCSVLANRCRFTDNSIAIAQPLDSRFIDCSFNKNEYSIISKANSGFTTMVGCRIEWGNNTGIVLNNSKEFTINSCEFDRHYNNAILIANSVRCNISNNIFRRSGADTNLSTEDTTNNCHIYANSNTNCIISGNITYEQNILDTGSAATRPSNCTNISNNINCVITNNILNGCTKSDKVAANIFENNINCIVYGNMPIDLP